MTAPRYVTELRPCRDLARTGYFRALRVGNAAAGLGDAAEAISLSERDQCMHNEVRLQDGSGRIRVGQPTQPGEPRKHVPHIGDVQAFAEADLDGAGVELGAEHAEGGVTLAAMFSSGPGNGTSA